MSPIPDFVVAIRARIGSDHPLWLPAVTAVVRRGDDVLLVKRSDNGRWTPVTGIVDPGEEPAVAAAREVTEETGVLVRVDRLASTGAGAPVTHDASTRAPSALQVMPRAPSAVNMNSPGCRGTWRGCSSRAPCGASSGTAPIKAVARGETAVSISFVHDGPGEKLQGFPVETVTPSEGTGAEIGSMSLIKGARNLEEAKKFYEWALTAQAQQFGAATRQYQLPANKSTPVDPRVPDFKKIKLIEYDYAKYGASAERRRLISRWEKEVNSLPK